ncbi:MAG: DUF5682 family protein [Pyrinomonadaceae bacterium MAG19_C2-C3]|nr:DUF5682 family protein [Pyrinomonadaceae bacterium MAG19_C2-C3]
MPESASIHIFGIRHHGPGSARSLRESLEKLQPDIILVEGPPDAQDMLPLLAHPEMQPPVALLVYRPDAPNRAVYYPFAVFSPEWQAISYGLSRGISVRFMDLPQAHQLDDAGDDEHPDEGAVPGDAPDESPDVKEESALRRDPLQWLAQAAGYSDGERWWEHIVEQRRDSTDIFEAVMEAMTALREAQVEVSRNDGQLSGEALLEARREAYMRQTIRTAGREGFGRIAIVCGAWHAPALAKMPTAKEDAALLKDLPEVKTAATWVPWTNGRLCFASGYGAGVESPGWYGHLWSTREGVVVRWMTKVAALLRDEDLDASPAQVIEAVRLAETLSHLRARSLPDLTEVNEAVQTVLCFGNDAPLRLIRQKLIIGETLGRVPSETPTIPLQHDLTREQKRLRLPAEATQKMLDLDLRKPTDIARSHLLHRLNLLGIPWGVRESVTGKSGTFHELWRTEWQPEFAVHLIEAGVWGNTVIDAAVARANDKIIHASDLPKLTRLLEQVLLADLPQVVETLVRNLQAEAARASDVNQLMQSLPALANVLRYGDVRRTNASALTTIIDEFVARIAVGLTPACSSLNDEAAAVMFDRLLQVDAVVSLLQVGAHLETWHGVLRRLSDQQTLHGLIAGRCCRLLIDANAYEASDTQRRLSLALSTASEPAQAARFVEGLLKGSGQSLLHTEALWMVLDEWVTGLSEENYIATLPLVRRTFATFTLPERRRMGERISHGSGRLAPRQVVLVELDQTRAEAVLPTLARLLGV